MNATGEHDTDFVGWTESQAGILRSMPAGTLGLDTENLAEEIADLGRSEIRETSTLLRQVLAHLVKLAAQPHAEPARHWMEEVLAFQGDAVLACSPGIRQRIDVATIWRLACNAARRSLAQYGVTIADLPAECPFTIEELLDADFDPALAAKRIAAAIVYR